MQSRGIETFGMLCMTRSHSLSNCRIPGSERHLNDNKMVTVPHEPISMCITAQHLVAAAARVIGVDAGPTKRNSGNGIIKISDCPAVCRKVGLVLAANALEEGFMALEDCAQAPGQVVVIHAAPRAWAFQFKGTVQQMLAYSRSLMNAPIKSQLKVVVRHDLQHTAAP